MQLYQQLPLMAASVERVRAAHPSALLKRRSRMLAVVKVFQKACEPLVRRFSGMHQIAPRLKAQTRWEKAQSQRLTCVYELIHSGLPTALLPVVTDGEKITVALAPQLCEYVRQPRLPHPNHERALFIGRIKTSRRHMPGRKNTQAFILREGRSVAMRFGLPPAIHWVHSCSRVNANDFHQILNRLRQTAKRRKCWHTRRDLVASLMPLAQPWVPHE